MKRASRASASMSVGVIRPWHVGRETVEHSGSPERVPHLPGRVQLRRRSARKRVQHAIRSTTEWIKSRRHPPGKELIQALNQRLIGHSIYYGLRGNAADLWRYFIATVRAAFKWLNRGGGKRRSFTWGRSNVPCNGSASLVPASPSRRCCSMTWCLHEIHARPTASQTKELDAGEPPVRVCGGGSG